MSLNDLSYEVHNHWLWPWLSFTWQYFSTRMYMNDFNCQYFSTCTRLRMAGTLTKRFKPIVRFVMPMIFMHTRRECFSLRSTYRSLDNWEKLFIFNGVNRSSFSNLGRRAVEALRQTTLYWYQLKSSNSKKWNISGFKFWSSPSRMTLKMKFTSEIKVKNFSKNTLGLHVKALFPFGRNCIQWADKCLSSLRLNQSPSSPLCELHIQWYIGAHIHTVLCAHGIHARLNDASLTKKFDSVAFTRLVFGAVLIKGIQIVAKKVKGARFLHLTQTARKKCTSVWHFPFLMVPECFAKPTYDYVM